MISLGDLTLVFFWIGFIFILHLSLSPFLRSSFSKVAVPLSFSLSLLFFTLLSYWITLGHLPVQLAIIPFLVGIGYTWYGGFCRGGIKGIMSRYSFFFSEWKYYTLFFGVFLIMLILRMYSPDISSAEKFMDHGFIASMMRTPMIPPLDPWFSGGDLSVYYYLGHWMLAVMGISTGVPSTVLFTLALPTIAALTAVNMYGVGHLLLPRFRLLPVLFLFLMNPAFVQLAISGTEWSKLLWDSTRVIDGTINEYPLFSFIFGDVHAHVLDFFPQTTLILLITLGITCWNVMKPVSRLILILSTSLALGSIPPTNTWDVLIQAPLIIVTGIILLVSSIDPRPTRNYSTSVVVRLERIFKEIIQPTTGRSFFKHFSSSRGALLYVVLVPVISILCYLPFYLMMKAQGIEGIGVVPSPSSVPQFLLVNGWFIAILVISLLPIFRRAPWILLLVLPFFATGYYVAAIPAVLLGAILIRREGATDLLAGAGLFILIFCEILYLRDNMGDQYFRMNTVFKFSITAWLLFSGAIACMLGKMFHSMVPIPSRTQAMVRCVVPLILLLLLLLPAAVTSVHVGSYSPTLDGLAWLSNSHPDDLAAVTWLKSQKGNFTLVEAESDDYGYYSRVSSFTGIPTLLGWPFHESMWRNNTPPGWYSQRTSVVRSIYEDPSLCQKLMKQYGISLLYVGPTEIEHYTVNLPSTGLDPVYQHGAVTIYRAI